MTTVETYEKQAKAALEERAQLIADLRTVEADSRMTAAEKRERDENIDRDVMRLEAEARDAVERGEREAEVRSLLKRSGAPGFLTAHPSWTTRTVGADSYRP
ncbi:hypothetical protein GCM10010503_02970 [Streptomyces lucensis JCM 4490]|uniref:Uncharacterized protein n=1 Tax=Streptomyces lucensis JCM 4490 TaxID=1306176 RepID=A0A918MK85_9ACTN|nr:hypothetical protein GCM10010503_02970 [Streptomyces lucensis JCM 4490]